MQRFGKTVFVACSRQLIREITNAADELDYLNEWPDDKRDAVFSVVRRLCSRVNDKLVSTTVAERAFIRWAKDNDVLEEITIPSWISGPRSGHGGIPI